MTTIFCEVEGCITKSTNFSKEFYQFPKIKSIRDIWVNFCGKPILFQKNTKYICSLHFEETAFITEIGEENGNTVLIRKLNPTAIPTLKPNFSSESINYIQYGDIKNYQDLKVLKDNNKSLEEKIQKLTYEISNLNGTIASQSRQFRCVSTCTKKSNDYLNIRNKGLLSKVFTPRQIRVLAGNQKKAQWSNDDKAIAVTIRYLTNAKFYDYLINQLNYPLPARSSIRRVASGTRRKKLPKLSITKEC